MAAARIVSYMLRSDGVTYQLRPCWTYSSLEGMLEEADDCKAILLLNLGASRNLTKLFRPNLLKGETKIYVMDCRRPVHLANVHAGQNVVIFWDSIQPDDVPSDGDNLSGKEDTSSEEESDESNNSESDDDNEDHEQDSDGEEEFLHNDDLPIKEVAAFSTVRDKAATSDNDGEDNYDGEDEGEEEEVKKKSGRDTLVSRNAKKRKIDDDDSVTTKEPDDSPDKNGLPILSYRQLHLQRRDRLRMYYSGGSFYGSPVAWIAYRLASQLRFGNKGDLLWLACVGLTDAYMHSRVDLTGYAALSMELKQSCTKLFPNDNFTRNHVVAEDLAGTAMTPGYRGTQVSLREAGRILTDQDYRFFLLRHTSLLDSMIHSPYVSTKLQLWTSHGMQQLQELLAKMGFPLDECRQPYAFMNPKFRRQLKEKMSEYAPVREAYLIIWL